MEAIPVLLIALCVILIVIVIILVIYFTLNPISTSVSAIIVTTTKDSTDAVNSLINYTKVIDNNFVGNMAGSIKLGVVKSSKKIVYHLSTGIGMVPTVAILDKFIYRFKGTYPYFNMDTPFIFIGNAGGTKDLNIGNVYRINKVIEPFAVNITGVENVNIEDVIKNIDNNPPVWFPKYEVQSSASENRFFTPEEITLLNKEYNVNIFTMEDFSFVTVLQNFGYTNLLIARMIADNGSALEYAENAPSISGVVNQIISSI
jgi:hypothetical protein